MVLDIQLNSATSVSYAYSVHDMHREQRSHRRQWYKQSTNYLHLPYDNLTIYQWSAYALKVFFYFVSRVNSIIYVFMH